MALEEGEWAMFLRVREGYIVGDGVFFIPSLVEKRRGTHWRPMADPPEGEEEERDKLLSALGIRIPEKEDETE